MQNMKSVSEAPPSHSLCQRLFLALHCLCTTLNILMLKQQVSFFLLQDICLLHGLSHLVFRHLKLFLQLLMRPPKTNQIFPRLFQFLQSIEKRDSLEVTYSQIGLRLKIVLPKTANLWKKKMNPSPSTGTIKGIHLEKVLDNFRKLHSQNSKKKKVSKPKKKKKKKSHPVSLAAYWTSKSHSVHLRSPAIDSVLYIWHVVPVEIPSRPWHVAFVLLRPLFWCKCEAVVSWGPADFHEVLLLPLQVHDKQKASLSKWKSSNPWWTDEDNSKWMYHHTPVVFASIHVRKMGVLVWETKVFMDWRILRKNLMLWGRSHWSLMLVICSSNHPIINTKRVRRMHQNNFKVRSLSWFLARTGSNSINVNLLEPSSCFSVESHFYHSIHRVFEVVPTCESVCVIWFSCKKCMTWEHKKELPGRPFTMDFSVILTGNIKVMWPEETSWDFPQWQSPEMSQPF